jgi:hypothetical protein
MRGLLMTSMVNNDPDLLGGPVRYEGLRAA